MTEPTVYNASQPKWKYSWLAYATFLVGVTAFLMSWIPVTQWLASSIAVVGIMMAITSVIISCVRHQRHEPPAALGLMISLVIASYWITPLLIALSVIYLVSLAFVFGTIYGKATK